jgi:hypothetical protein
MGITASQTIHTPPSWVRRLRMPEIIDSSNKSRPVARARLGISDAEHEAHLTAPFETDVVQNINSIQGVQAIRQAKIFTRVFLLSKGTLFDIDKASPQLARLTRIVHLVCVANIRATEVACASERLRVTSCFKHQGITFSDRSSNHF